MSQRSILPRPLVLLFAFFLVLPAPRAAQCKVELQELAPPDGQAGDVFGYRIAAAGDVAVVAATFDDDLGLDAGSAYVYRRNPASGWVLEKKLLASDGQAGDYFAYAVAVDGENVLVGAPYADRGLADRGAVYIYSRDQGGPGNWGEVGSFVPPSAGIGAHFGHSLAVDGSRLLVGAPRQDSLVPGQAFVFRRSTTNPSGWALEQELAAADPTTGLAFGHAVALDGRRLAVSGSVHTSLPFAPSYVVHVFERDEASGIWEQVQTLASDAAFADFFGYRIALAGDLLAVVAPGELDLGSGRQGALYLFRRGQDEPGVWGTLRRIPPPPGTTEPFLPEQVVLSGDWLVAGAPSSGDVGAVYVFGRDVGGPDAWGLVGRHEPPGVAPGAATGQGVAITGDVLLAGASGNYSSAGAGEVYVLALDRMARAVWRNDGRGVNVDSLRASAPVLGSILTADVALYTTNHAFAALTVFADEAEVTLPGGQVLLGRHRIQTVVAPGPVAGFAFSVPDDPGLCGRTIVLQAAHLGVVRPFALSNAEDLVLGLE